MNSVSLFNYNVFKWANRRAWQIRGFLGPDITRVNDVRRKVIFFSLPKSGTLNGAMLKSVKLVL